MKSDSEFQMRKDWGINNSNIFGLEKHVSLSLSAIQYEIMCQLNGANINSISDYFKAEIDISKEIILTEKLTIEKVLSEILDF